MPTLKTQLVALGCLATLLVIAVPVGAAITSLTVNPCLSGKVKAVGKSLAARTNCLSKDAKRGTPDPTCLQKASDKFTGDGTPASGTFERLETRFPNSDPTPCLTYDDQGTFEGTIATYAASVPAVTGSAVGRCDAAKIKCVGKYVAGITSCFAKAAKSTGTVDGTCAAKAATKLVGAGRGCLDKAVLRGDCTHADTQVDTLQADADAFIRSGTCALDPTNPGCGCPTTFSFTATGSDADLDVGWTGQDHDGDMPSMSRLTLAVSGCPNSTSPCGTCTLSGPLTNPGGAPFANRRCGGDASWIACTSDSDCAGTGNACVFFFGPPRPDHLGFGELCTTTEIAGPITGTVDPDAGSVAINLPVVSRSYFGPTSDDPCPLCVGGLCSGGARNGFACVVQGHSTRFGDDVSLDCPPSPGTALHPESVVLTLDTGTQTLTLGASNPPCSAIAFTGARCFCSTCNDANGEACSSDAMCPPSGGNPGVCGGKRCFGGGNVGTPCATPSECPGSSCGVVGEPTAPNHCDDGVCTPNTPPDTDSANEGTCAAGPLDTYCGMQTYRGCGTDSDCPLPGDSCLVKNRDCFTTSGVLGDTVSATGQASPTTPTLATLYCAGATPASIVNNVRGLPGLGRFTIPGIVRLN